MAGKNRERWIETCECQRHAEGMRWCIRSRHGSGMIWTEDLAPHFRTREAMREAMREQARMDRMTARSAP